MVERSRSEGTGTHSPSQVAFLQAEKGAGVEVCAAGFHALKRKIILALWGLERISSFINTC